jgi:ABC-type nitrate/sulfonate/bicarbonate transport system permease component
MGRRAVVPLVLLALWQYASTAGFFDPSFVPSPVSVVTSWWQWIFGRRQAQRVDIAGHDHEAGQFLAARGDAVLGRLLDRVDGIGASTRQADDLSLRALRP